MLWPLSPLPPPPPPASGDAVPWTRLEAHYVPRPKAPPAYVVPVPFPLPKSPPAYGVPYSRWWAPPPPPLHPPPAKLQLTAYPHGDPLFPLPARHQFTDSYGYPLFSWSPAQQQLPPPRQQQFTSDLHGSHPPPAQQQAAWGRSKSHRKKGKWHGRHGWHGWHGSREQHGSTWHTS